MPNIHSVQGATIQGYIEKLKHQSTQKREVARAFEDPIREFARASQIEPMVRNWLTYPIEERKRLVKGAFGFIPRRMGDEREGVAPETPEVFKARCQERWRGLNVIIQEESRAEAGNRSFEVAVAALKQLFPEESQKQKAQGG
jgi:hypothetical protein